eukprot:Sdes_comp9958_c0_seq1m1512
MGTKNVSGKTPELKKLNLNLLNKCQSSSKDAVKVSKTKILQDESISDATSDIDVTEGDASSVDITSVTEETEEIEEEEEDVEDEEEEDEEEEEDDEEIEEDDEE